MRRVDENRAENFIKKHQNHKKWIAFALCIALLTGSGTLYMLNKPATAMTEEGAKSVGVVLETADSQFEQDLIDKTMENKEDEESAIYVEGSGDDEEGQGEEGQGEGTGSEDSEGFDESEESETPKTEESEETQDEADAEKKELLEGDKDTKETRTIKKVVKKVTTKTTETTKTVETTKKAEESKASIASETEKDIDDEKKKDVVITVLYQDKNGEEIQESKELSITESLNLKEEVQIPEGYLFHKGLIDEKEITSIVKKTGSIEDTSEETVSASSKETSEDTKETAGKTTETTETTDAAETAETAEPKVTEEKEVTEEVTEEVVYIDVKTGNEISLEELEELKKVETVVIEEETSEDVVEKEITKEKQTESEEKTEEEKTTASEKTAQTAEITETDNKADVSEDADKTSEDGYTYYEATLADGSTLEIKEDAELKLVYHKVNEKEVFEYTGQGLKVTVKLSDPSVLPEGVELKVTPLEKDTEGYNYDAYIDALNENAKDIAKELGQEEATKHDDSNTMLLDIAFIMDEKEYEPKEGTVSVSIEFEAKQISEGLKAKDSEAVAVIHMPVSEEVMKDLDQTSEATQITASDIDVDVMKSSSVEITDGAESVSFETESFSIFAVTTNTIRSAYSWEGTGLTDNSTRAIVNSLGDAVYFGVVADYFYSTAAHYESNVAVTRLGSVGERTLFDYTKNYIYSDEFKNYSISVTKKSSNPGTFYFGAYTDEAGTNRVDTFSIDATSIGDDGLYTGYASLTGATSGSNKVYIYELTGEDGEIATEDNFSYTVSYSGTFADTSDATDAIISSYITEWDGSDDTLKSYLSGDSTVYYSRSYGDESYNKVTKNGDTEVYSGTLPVKAADLLADARSLSSVLPHAASAGDVEVVNVIATTGNFMTDLFNAGNERFGWTDVNNVTNKDKGIQIDSGKLLVINLDLTNYDSYEITPFYVNGVYSSEDFNAFDAYVIINPVRYNNGSYSPYDGELALKETMGTVLAPSASVVEREINGAVIGKEVHHETGEIHKTTLIKHREMQGNVTVTNTAGAGNVEILLHKLVDDKDPGAATFNFTIKRLKDDHTGWSNGKLSDGATKTTLTNTGSNISYVINPEYWSMTPGNTYIFRVTEDEITDGTDLYEIDKSRIYIKVEYKAEGQSTVSYYYHGQDEDQFDFWNNKINEDIKTGNIDVINGICNDPDRLITSDNAIFKNTTKKNISISVVKEWDELVGLPKNGDSRAMPDSIWDVTFKLYSSADNGATWQLAKEYTIMAPRQYQPTDGAPFEGDLNDYHENWDFKSNVITFDDLNGSYMYKIEEYYESTKLGESEAVKSGDNKTTQVNGDTVNGFKLEYVETTSDANGNLNFKLHNTPYIQIYKYWQFEGQDVSGEATKDYGDVYVKLYIKYRNDNTNVPFEDISGDNVIETANNGKIIKLSYSNNWFAEFPLPRKMDESVDPDHVYQAVYSIVECTIDGELLPESSLITYGSIRKGNVTRVLEKEAPENRKGFSDKTQRGSTKHHGAWTQGNNYPVNILTVTNNRGANVLPNSGGTGTGQYIALGALLISIAFAGFMLLRKRKTY